MACCDIGARPDIETIHSDMRALGIRATAEKYTLSRHLLTRHLKEHLGEDPVRLPVGLARTVAKATKSVATPSPRPLGESVPPTNPSVAMAGPGDERPPVVIPYGVAMLFSPRWGHPQLAQTEEQRLAFLSDLIESNRFYFKRTLDGLAEQWKVSDAEVRRLFLAVRTKLTNDRQGLGVQLEITLSALEAQERLAMQEWRRLRKTQPSVARGYLALARQIRGDIAEFVGLRKIRQEVELNVWTRPEFVTAVDRITDASLGVLLPGTDHDEQGMTALCERTETAFGEKLTNRDKALIAEALAQAAAVVDDRIVAIVAEASGKSASSSGEPLAAE